MSEVSIESNGIDVFVVNGVRIAKKLVIERYGKLCL
jgi:hypothetical protein